MIDLREACEEWLDNPGTIEAVLEDLVTFVQAQRLSAAREVLVWVEQVLGDAGFFESKSLTPAKVADALRAVRHSIETEGV